MSRQNSGVAIRIFFLLSYYLLGLGLSCQYITPPIGFLPLEGKKNNVDFLAKWAEITN
jgi:hypothetical protein